LFFVSVGLLFDHRVLVDHPAQVLAVLGVIVVGKLIVSFCLLRLLSQTGRSAITLASSLAQIGEFSFILVAMGVSLGLLERETQALVVAGSLVSITLNQPLGAWLARALGRRDRAPIVPTLQPPVAIETEFAGLTGH